MFNKTITLSVLTSEEKEVNIYKKLLKNKEVHIHSTYLFKNLKKNKVLNESILLIDLCSLKEFQLLQNIAFHNETFIMIITSIDIKHFNAPFIFDNCDYLILKKPLDFELFYRSLDDCIYDLKRERNLSQKASVLSYIVDDSPLNMAVFDLTGQLLYANEYYLTLNHLHESSIDKTTFKELVCSKLVFRDIIYSLKNNRMYIEEEEIAHKTYKSFFYMINNAQYCTHIIMDVSFDKSVYKDLYKKALFFEQSHDAAMITDVNGVITNVNEAFSKITGFSEKEAVGETPRIIKSGLQLSDFYEHMWESLNYHGQWQGEVWNKRKNGEIYPEWLSISKIEDPLSTEMNYIALFTDISSLKENARKLEFYANYDSLTGLLNRAQFETLLNHTIESAKRNNRQFALMFIDVDNFKDINDTYGHDVGDIVLKTVASRFRKMIRKEDILARIGGDEFNIVLDYINDESGVFVIAEKLNESIKKEIVIGERSFYISLSIGIALYPNHGENLLTLSKNADAAMYEVKRNGRNGYMLYDVSFSEKIMSKVFLQNNLKEAILNKDFVLHYQPIVDIMSNQIKGVEALIRWNHPTRGLIMPDEFIGISENQDMIIDIGKFVMERSFEDYQSIVSELGHKEFKMSINVSAKEFFQKEYTQTLLEFCKDFLMNPKSIELEITETHIMKNLDLAIEKMVDLKKQGFSFALDDFGTGYSSLSYLRKFPIDKLKIDKSFIDHICENSEDLALVETIVNISKIFGLQVQAEGIEKKEHVDVLKRLKCDLGQGFYFGRPLSLEKLLQLIGEQNADTRK
jgi:diguanylate cyclase (GGDEF)-like protein/PAS domain S-box-containing protein